VCASQGVDAIGEYLRGMKLRLEGVRGLQYVGKGSPSSGFVGMMLLLQMCQHVDVFGVGQNSASTSWCDSSHAPPYKQSARRQNSALCLDPPPVQWPFRTLRTVRV
jgi:hypothetical protein